MIIPSTNIVTPLGKIILGKVIQSGRLVVAGPNKSKELGQVLNLLRQEKVNFIIVDGALNRIAPMVEVDVLILATGAARTPDILKLAFETQHIVKILQYPVLDTKGAVIFCENILDIKKVDVILKNFKGKDTLYINGVIGEDSFKYLVSRKNELRGKRLIFSDPIKLLVCCDINNLRDFLSELQKAQVEIGVRKSIKVIAVTVNPYYPQYRFASNNYVEAFVDCDKLQESIKKNIPVPVYDVVKEGSQKLFQDILEYQ